MNTGRAVKGFFASILLVATGLANASVGLDVIPATEGVGPITLFYPSSTPSVVTKRGPFTLDVAEKGAPEAGNGRLIVVSHGSGGSVWPQSDLARTLVEAGFVVAMPEHVGDNFHDMSDVGPRTWKRRPGEVSHAIDAVLADPRFAPLVAKDKVGVYGMSAGGLTALTFAGGRWSPAQWVKHCEAHIA
ncbi:MAG: dienelactone hydrolase family protein [Burkholderiales bacterium]